MPALVPSQMTVLISANITSTLPAPSCRPYQQIIPPPAVAVTSLAVINYSYGQVRYVQLQTAGNLNKLLSNSPLFLWTVISCLQVLPVDFTDSLKPQWRVIIWVFFLFQMSKVQTAHPQRVLFHSSVAITAISKARVSHVTVPSFLYFTLDDPRQYALLKTALIHLLPHDESEQFKYHVLLDHFEAWHSLSSCHWLLHIILILTPEYISLTAEVWPARTEWNYLLCVCHVDSRNFSDFAIRVQAGKWWSRCIVTLCFSCAAASRKASLSICCKLCQIHSCYKTWHPPLFLSILRCPWLLLTCWPRFSNSDFQRMLSKGRSKRKGIVGDDKHRASHGDLRKLCPKCRGKHDGVFYEVKQPQNDLSTSCLICSNCSSWVLLKVVSQALHFPCVQCRQEVQNAFTAETLGLAPQSDPVHILQRLKHLHCLPPQVFQKVQPLLLIWSLISCIWDSVMLRELKKGSGRQWNWLATPAPLIL